MEVPLPLVKNEIIDFIELDDETTPEEVINKWHEKIRKRFNQQMAPNNEIEFVKMLEWYQNDLKVATKEMEDLDRLEYVLLRHIKTIEMSYKRLKKVCATNDSTYLQIMEEVLPYYMDTAMKNFTKRKKEVSKPVYRKTKAQICRKFKCLLLSCLFKNLKSILHVFIRCRLEPEEAAYRDVINNCYSYFLSRQVEDKTEENYCRCYIMIERWKTLRKEEEKVMLDASLDTMFDIKSEERKQKYKKSLEKIVRPSVNSIKGMARDYFNYIRTSDICEEIIEIDLDPQMSPEVPRDSNADWNSILNDDSLQSSAIERWHLEIEKASAESDAVTVKHECDDDSDDCIIVPRSLGKTVRVTELCDDEHIAEIWYDIKEDTKQLTKTSSGNTPRLKSNKIDRLVAFNSRMDNSLSQNNRKLDSFGNSSSSTQKGSFSKNKTLVNLADNNSLKMNTTERGVSPILIDYDASSNFTQSTNNLSKSTILGDLSDIKKLQITSASKVNEVEDANLSEINKIDRGVSPILIGDDALSNLTQSTNNLSKNTILVHLSDKKKSQAASTSKVTSVERANNPTSQIEFMDTNNTSSQSASTELCDKIVEPSVQKNINVNNAAPPPNDKNNVPFPELDYKENLSELSAPTERAGTNNTSSQTTSIEKYAKHVSFNNITINSLDESSNKEPDVEGDGSSNDLTIKNLNVANKSEIKQSNKESQRSALEILEDSVNKNLEKPNLSSASDTKKLKNNIDARREKMFSEIEAIKELPEDPMVLVFDAKQGPALLRLIKKKLEEDEKKKKNKRKKSQTHKEKIDPISGSGKATGAEIVNTSANSFASKPTPSSERIYEHSLEKRFIDTDQPTKKITASHYYSSFTLSQEDDLDLVSPGQPNKQDLCGVVSEQHSQPTTFTIVGTYDIVMQGSQENLEEPSLSAIDNNNLNSDVLPSSENSEVLNQTQSESVPTMEMETSQNKVDESNVQSPQAVSGTDTLQSLENPKVFNQTQSKSVSTTNMETSETPAEDSNIQQSPQSVSDVRCRTDSQPLETELSITEPTSLDVTFKRNVPKETNPPKSTDRNNSQKMNTNCETDAQVKKITFTATEKISRSQNGSKWADVIDSQDFQNIFSGPVNNQLNKNSSLNTDLNFDLFENENEPQTDQNALVITQKNIIITTNDNNYNNCFKQPAETSKTSVIKHFEDNTIGYPELKSNCNNTTKEEFLASFNIERNNLEQPTISNKSLEEQALLSPIQANNINNLEANKNILKPQYAADVSVESADKPEVANELEASKENPMKEAQTLETTLHIAPPIENHADDNESCPSSPDIVSPPFEAWTGEKFLGEFNAQNSIYPVKQNGPTGLEDSFYLMIIDGKEVKVNARSLSRYKIAPTDDKLLSGLKGWIRNPEKKFMLTEKEINRWQNLNKLVQRKKIIPARARTLSLLKNAHELKGSERSVPVKGVPEHRHTHENAVHLNGFHPRTNEVEPTNKVKKDSLLLLNEPGSKYRERTNTDHSDVAHTKKKHNSDSKLNGASRRTKSQPKPIIEPDVKPKPPKGILKKPLKVSCDGDYLIPKLQVDLSSCDPKCKVANSDISSNVSQKRSVYFGETKVIEDIKKKNPVKDKFKNDIHTKLSAFDEKPNDLEKVDSFENVIGARLRSQRKRKRKMQDYFDIAKGMYGKK